MGQFAKLFIIALATGAVFAVVKGAGGNGVSRPPRAPTEAEAVRRAVAAGGSRDAMANAAYWSSHPECPRQLDPNNPAHAGCITIWRRIRDLVDSVAGNGPSTGDPEADEACRRVRSWYDEVHGDHGWDVEFHKYKGHCISLTQIEPGRGYSTKISDEHLTWDHEGTATFKAVWLGAKPRAEALSAAKWTIDTRGPDW